MRFKLFIIFVITILLFSNIFGERIGVLDKILKPKMVKVFEDELFVVEDYKIYIYSLDDLKLKQIIGKKGDGPGEYKLDPSRPLMITVNKQNIIAESRYKVVFFTRAGKFIKEIKKTNFTTLQVLPIGKNYLVHRYIFAGPKKDKAYFTLNIFDNNMKQIKELHRQKFFSFEDKMFLMPDSISYRIYNNKIFVEKSTDGFIIDKYDLDGNKIATIKKEFDKIEITKAEKDVAYKEYLGIPSLRRLKKTRGEAVFKQYINSLKFVYPEFHLPIKDITIGNDIIYVRTSKIKDNKEQFLLLKLNGDLIREKYLPKAKKPDFIVRIQGDKKYFSIYNGKYYYLKLSDTGDDEEWILYVEEI